jgi:GNAT superfamily N-acetyltransferase
MGRVELRMFADELVPDAGALLAERHRAQRAVEPLLSPQFDFAAEVQNVWEREGASGAAALRGGRLVGYLVGAPRPNGGSGSNVWVELAGHAVVDAETIRDLYALAAAGWVDEGRSAAHYVLVPATDAPLTDAWFRLGFGAQHAHGIQKVPDGSAATPVRQATVEDLDLCMQLEDVLYDHQQRAPVFASRPPKQSEDESRSAWRAELEDESSAIFLTVKDGRAAAAVSVAPIEHSGAHSGLARPDNACILGWAATAEEHRGQGYGVALTNAVFGWARERGYQTIVVDWRVTNVTASRFWPARGFRPSFLRLHRAILNH